MKKGIQQGKHEQSVSTLQRLLQKRFGDSPDWVSPLVQRSELEQLESWEEQLFDVNSLEELFGQDSPSKPV